MEFCSLMPFSLLVLMLKGEMVNHLRNFNSVVQKLTYFKSEFLLWTLFIRLEGSFQRTVCLVLEQEGNSS